MSERDNKFGPDSTPQSEVTAADATTTQPSRRQSFIEPTISVPQNVLAATTFFLQATPGTGAADIPKRLFEKFSSSPC